MLKKISINKRWDGALFFIVAITVAAAFVFPGDPLPAAGAVDRIVASGHFGLNNERVEFDVPLELWPQIRVALQPASRDFHPANWVGTGTLAITTRRGSAVHVSLSETDERPGAFAAGPTFERRVYYRGGDSNELARQMAAAYKTATKDEKE